MKSKPPKRTAEEKLRLEAVMQNYRQKSYDLHEIKPWADGDAEIPTTEQLATLAANLSRHVTDNHDELCSTALNLWATAAKFVYLQKRAGEDFMREWAKIDKTGIPKPRDFPVSRDEFLRLVLPGKDTGETAALCREWLRFKLAVVMDLKMDPGCESQPEITKEQIDAAFGDMQRTPMGGKAYYQQARSFLEWYRPHNPERVSAIRSESGTKAWCDEQDKNHEAFPDFQKYCMEAHCKPYKRIFAAWLETHKPGPAKPPKRKLKKKLGSK